MATKDLQQENRPMFREIKSIIDRSQDTLLADAIGAAALITMFMIGLYLPLLA